MEELTVSVAESLESRPAALFVQTAGRFKSEIHVRIGDKTVNAKSIMGIISLGILDGQDVQLTAKGDDAREAVAELARFLTAR